MEKHRMCRENEAECERTEKMRVQNRTVYTGSCQKITKFNN